MFTTTQPPAVVASSVRPDELALAMLPIVRVVAVVCQSTPWSRPSEAPKANEPSLHQLAFQASPVFPELPAAPVELILMPKPLVLAASVVAEDAAALAKLTEELADVQRAVREASLGAHELQRVDEPIWRVVKWLPSSICHLPRRHTVPAQHVQGRSSQWEGVATENLFLFRPLEGRDTLESVLFLLARVRAGTLAARCRVDES
mmetsp:Transcript_149737/g.480851  ORF Transcript_149737/g.480851 Transcript_149737/m.480851 type:complete len:204 (-) Transcript_149737:102-713(-)